MKKVWIKYNPYKLETEIKVDEKGLDTSNAAGIKFLEEIIKDDKGTRLQEWVEKFPVFLRAEFCDDEFDITFHGTSLDYEDLRTVFTDAQDKGTIKDINFSWLQAKETLEKEAMIEGVFNQIQTGPFEELRNDEITNAFQLAKSDEFELCVVATMSAGKSTLINAMLGTKLLPSKQEACTAIITRIKDADGEESDKDGTQFQAHIYDKDGRLIEWTKNLTYSAMERLNSDENVSEIRVSGNIPFVTSEDVSLVMIDTPGPNNARNFHHKEVQSKLLSKSSKALVLYIMTGEFGTDDDNELLKRVVESMSVGGKQSKDRFIFVVNKLDDRKKEDGDTEQTLERIRDYLKNHGVNNPNLFPAAALPALWIRQFQNGELSLQDDEDEILEMETKIKKINRNSNGNMHFENYASLPPSMRCEIVSHLEAAHTSWKGGENENPEEALIHTGVVSIESAIRQYVQKYAKTAKVKNIVDTFTHKMDELGCFEKIKKELTVNQEERDRILNQITAIKKKIKDGESAKPFQDAMESGVKNAQKESERKVAEIVERYQAVITRLIDVQRGKEVPRNEVEGLLEPLKRSSKELEPYFKVELDRMICDDLINAGEVLVKQYKKRLGALAEELDACGTEIRIDPLKLMSGSVADHNVALNDLVHEKDIEDGEEWIENTGKAWYKPWTWFEESGYYQTQYKTVEYFNANELAQAFFVPIQSGLMGNGRAALEHVGKQSANILEHFKTEFKRLDEVLKKKLSELERYATDQENAEAYMKECEDKLKWLDNIKGQVESILEI